MASTISRATWIPSVAHLLRRACVSAREAWATADQMPRPGMARRAEPPVTWMRVLPEPASLSVRMPVDRNTNACSATAAAHPRKPSTVASPIGPPPKPLSS